VVSVSCALLIGTAQAQVLRIDLDDDPYVEPSDELDTRGIKPILDPDDDCAYVGIEPNCNLDPDGEAPWWADDHLNFFGEIAPDWYVAYPCWINTNNGDQFHYEIHRDTDIKTQGAASMRIETTDEPDSQDASAIEDIYLAHRFPTVPGAEYAVTFDLRLSDMRYPDPNPFGIGLPDDPWIMYAVVPDGSLDADDIVDIEDRHNPEDDQYPCFVRPDTIRVPPENVDEQWHTYLVTFTAEAENATFVLYIRNWWTPDDLVQPNYLDNIVVEQLPLFASSTIRNTGQTGGTAIDATTYQGARFHLDEPMVIDEIGGHLVGSGDVFGIITRLSGPGAYPPGPPFGPGDVAFFATLPLDSSSDDVRASCNIALQPGDYALIFGSGGFGATGTGAMPMTDVDLGTATYIEWDGSQWTENADAGRRFVVVGSILIDAPVTSVSGCVVLATALLVAGTVLVARRRVRPVSA